MQKKDIFHFVSSESRRKVQNFCFVVSRLVKMFLTCTYPSIKNSTSLDSQIIESHPILETHSKLLQFFRLLVQTILKVRHDTHKQQQQRANVEQWRMLNFLRSVRFMSSIYILFTQVSAGHDHHRKRRSIAAGEKKTLSGYGYVAPLPYRGYEKNS